MKSSSIMSDLRKNLVAGLLTFIPIWITWLILAFLFRQLTRFGTPGVKALSAAVRGYSPIVADWVLNTRFQSFLAMVLTLLILYLLGWFASRLLGKRLLGLFDRVMDRIPLVQNVYGGSKKLLAALQQKPDHVERVVLIDFPSPEMKTVGFVTRLMRDRRTGRQYAAVYVPTTPNPTSGYLEIVPHEKVVSTDWTMDEAMTFIISGGAVAPDNFHFTGGERDEG